MPPAGDRTPIIQSDTVYANPDFQESQPGPTTDTSAREWNRPWMNGRENSVGNNYSRVRHYGRIPNYYHVHTKNFSTTVQRERYFKLWNKNNIMCGLQEGNDLLKKTDKKLLEDFYS